MPVTREADFPVDIAQLVQAFNVAADGFDANTVLNAAAQMVAAGVGYIAKDKGIELEKALEYADYIASIIKAEIKSNWERAPQASDIPVKPS